MSNFVIQHRDAMPFRKLIVGCVLLAATAQAQPKRPNIVVIFSDDHAQQSISAYGSKLMQTPAIDRLAKEGALFSNSFVTNSICAPSRAVLLTGKYGHKSGLIDNSAGRSFDGSQQQIQKLLAAQGYQTAWIGKWHLQTLPQGFQHWHILPDQGHYYNPDFINMNNDTLRHEGYVSTVITDFSLDWLRQQTATDKPFFLVIGHKATHRTWLPDLQDLGAYDSVQFDLPATFYDGYTGRRAAQEQDMSIKQTMLLDYDLKVNADFDKGWMYRRLNEPQRQQLKKYYAGVSASYEKVKADSNKLTEWKYQRYLKDYLATAKSMDRNIGRVLNYLDSAGLSNETIVVYASDQGFYLGEHGWFDKRFMYEESMRTPLLMRYPKHIQPGTQVPQLVMNMDLAPTLLQLAGVPVPADIQGKSMVPLWQKKSDTNTWRSSLYYHYYEYPEPHRVAPHIGIRTAQYKLIFFYGPFEQWELYDLRSDPSEMKNIAQLPAMAAVKASLQQALLQLARDYEDKEAVQLLQKAMVTTK